MTEIPSPFHESLAWLIREGQQHKNMPIAVATLIGKAGKSPRPLGAQLVCQSPAHSVGMISGGCVDAIVMTDCLSIDTVKSATIEIYGNGLPYMDVRLPCGSLLYILHDQDWKPQLLEEIDQAARSRQAVTLTYDHQKKVKKLSPAKTAPLTDQFDAFWQTTDIARADITNRKHDQEFLGYRKMLVPKLKLVIAGEKSPIAHYLCLFAQAHGMEVTLSDRVIHATQLDRWSACITLLHDHDQEIPLLQNALNSAAFFIGALGSRQTHSTRCTYFKDLGYPKTQIDRLEGPVGLDIGAANPVEIATSIMASLIGKWRSPYSASLSRKQVQAPQLSQVVS